MQSELLLLLLLVVMVLLVVLLLLLLFAAKACACACEALHNLSHPAAGTPPHDQQQSPALPVVPSVLLLPPVQKLLVVGIQHCCACACQSHPAGQQ